MTQPNSDAGQARDRNDGKPSELIPTSMRGVFLTEPASGGFVPRFVTRTESIRVRRRMRRPGDNSNLDRDWAGVFIAGNWTSATGTWVVPVVSKPDQPEGTDGGWDSSSWVGLDGASFSDDVLQAGVEQAVTGHGEFGIGEGDATYSAWFEWFGPNTADSPDYLHEVVIPNFEVNPGDSVSCTIQYNGPPAPAAAGGALDGYETTFNDQQHVNFLDADGNVHEFYFDGSAWQHNNLTSLAAGSAPPAAPGSPLDGYETAFNDQHVNYLDADGNVHELYYDGSSWQHNNLTAFATGSPPAAVPGSPLDGYQTAFNNQQHVNYLDADGNVHELYYDGSSWQHNNLTALASGSPPAAVPGSPLDGYQTTFNDQQHVNYLDADGNVHELYYDGSSWQHNNLTALASGSPPAAVPGSPLDGYQTTFNDQQHVNYLDADGNVHELYYDGSSWQHNNLTALAAAPAAMPGSRLDGYQTAYNSQQHVNYLDVYGNVHELYYDGSSWQHNNLTALAYALDAQASGVQHGLLADALDGYQTAYNSQQHVNYLDTAGDVHELYYDGSSWRENNLTMIARGSPPPVAPGSALDGYSTEYNSQQHVNYLDTAGNVHELYYDGTDWVHNNLTEVAKADAFPAGAGSPLAGYQSIEQQSVNYLDPAGAVHQLTYANGWIHTNLSTAAVDSPPGSGSPPPAAPDSALAGYGDSTGQMVYYLDADGNVQVMAISINVGWNHGNATMAAGATAFPAAPGSRLTAYAGHVNYLDTAGNVHELYWDADGGHHNNLTAIAAGSPPPAAAGSPLDGYWTYYNSQPHVNYLDTDGNVHELYYDGSGWKHNNLTEIAAGSPPPAAAGSPLDGYSTEYNNQQHVNYLDFGGDVHELYYNGSQWVHNDLTEIAYAQDGPIPGAPVAAGASPLAGYSTDYNSQQHVTYLDAAGHVHELYYNGSQWVHNDLTLFAGRTGQITLANVTTGVQFTLSLLPPPGVSFAGQSAEWIMEAPNTGVPVTSLPKFTEVKFAQAGCSGPGGATGDPAQGDTVDIFGFGDQLTSTTVAPGTVTIDFIAP